MTHGTPLSLEYQDWFILIEITTVSNGRQWNVIQFYARFLDLVNTLAHTLSKKDKELLALLEKTKDICCSVKFLYASIRKNATIRISRLFHLNRDSNCFK